MTPNQKKRFLTNFAVQLFDNQNIEAGKIFNLSAHQNNLFHIVIFYLYYEEITFRSQSWDIYWLSRALAVKYQILSFNPIPNQSLSQITWECVFQTDCRARHLKALFKLYKSSHKSFSLSLILVQNFDVLSKA